LSVFADERVQVGAFFDAGALEFGDEFCPVVCVGGHAAVDAGEAFVSVNFAGVGAGALVAAGGGADVGEVGGERPGVAAVDPLVDAGDRGAVLGGLVADVGDDGAGFVLGGGVVGEAVEDDADGAGFRGFRTLGARRALSLVNHGARGAPLLVRRGVPLALGVV